jgi:hypothetical protein
MCFAPMEIVCPGVALPEPGRKPCSPRLEGFPWFLEIEDCQTRNGLGIEGGMEMSYIPRTHPPSRLFLLFNSLHFHFVL